MDDRFGRVRTWVVLALVLTSTSCGHGSSNDSTPTGDAILPRGPEGSTMVIDVGKKFAYGWDEIRVAPGHQITLVDIESRGEIDSLEQLGSVLAGRDRHIAIYQMIRQWPPTKPILGAVEPAIGATLTSDPSSDGMRGYDLFVGYRLIDDVTAFRRDVVITYREDGQLYQQVMPWQLVVCPPMTNKQCEQQADDLGAG